MGNDRVLRIYRRDTAALQRERCLLDRTWQRLRVPQVHEQGDDFLLLEYVTHSPLCNAAEHGHAAGLALAEIHQQRFDTCGLFGNEIEIAEPWHDFPQTMIEYLKSHSVSNEGDGGLLRSALQLLEQKSESLRHLCRFPVLLHGDFKASNLHWSGDQLLVLDWEFSYAGPASMDIGQLVRWGCPDAFRTAFENAYSRSSGLLADDWQGAVQVFDMVNLVGLLSKARDGSQQQSDCREQLQKIVTRS